MALKSISAGRFNEENTMTTQTHSGTVSNCRYVGTRVTASHGERSSWKLDEPITLINAKADFRGASSIR
ncbi:hypothetical protein LAB1_15390 [Roseibium sp. LAB1]